MEGTPQSTKCFYPGQHWIEFAWDSVPRQTNWYPSIAADWIVPAAPTDSAYSWGQVYYSFPGLESWDGGTRVILQPIIQYGATPQGGGNLWTMAGWMCDTLAGCGNGDYAVIHAGDLIHGTVTASNCSGHACLDVELEGGPARGEGAGRGVI